MWFCGRGLKSEEMRFMRQCGMDHSGLEDFLRVLHFNSDEKQLEDIKY